MGRLSSEEEESKESESMGERAYRIEPYRSDMWYTGGMEDMRVCFYMHSEVTARGISSQDVVECNSIVKASHLSHLEKFTV